MEQLHLEDVNNIWQAVAFVASIAVVTGSGWLMMRTKRTADQEQEKAAPVLAAAQEAADLGPAVTALSAELAEVQQELKHMTPIVRIKYPLALDHISTLHTAEPDLTSRFPIPKTLREDMEE